jgi:hypothetical protein
MTARERVKTRYVWLIELASSDMSAPVYLRRHPDGTLSWTGNVYRAAEFATKEMGAQFAAQQLSADVRVCEHGLDD